MQGGVILVTGGTGLAGSFIVRELQARGHALRVLARPASAPEAERLGAELALGDLADADSLRRAAQGIAGVVHAACTLSQDPTSDIAAMQTLLEVWDTGPFVFISSVDVYGYPQYVSVDEDHPLDEAFSGYARGKVHCEGLLREAAQVRGRDDFAILRPPHIWGPHPRCQQRLLEAGVLQSQPILLPGVTRDEWSQYGDAWVDTHDLAWAAAECLARPLGEAFNVITGHFTWHDFYAELIRLTGSHSRIEHRPLEELPDKRFYAQTWRYSGQRLEQRLGFRPSRRWQDTLAEIVRING
jgi:nucleoside-diphosphate-sugar epimerase